MMKATIARIEQMERVYDDLQRGIGTAEEQAALRQLLTDYLDSGLWLSDYTMDEQGLLPATLKRGVLSQDGLYNLLCELPEDMEEEA